MKQLELAEALGVAPQTLHGYLRKGLTRPAEGETVAQWVERANAWRKQHRGKPGPEPLHAEDGPRDGESLHHWTVRYRKAKALAQEQANQVAAGELHSRVECERDQVRRCGELSMAFGNLSDVLARRLFQAPSPEYIKAEVDAEVRRRLELLSGGGDADLGADAGNAGRAAAAGADDGQPVG